MAEGQVCAEAFLSSVAHEQSNCWIQNQNITIKLRSRSSWFLVLSMHISLVLFCRHHANCFYKTSSPCDDPVVSIYVYTIACLRFIYNGPEASDSMNCWWKCNIKQRHNHHKIEMKPNSSVCFWVHLCVLYLHINRIRQQGLQINVRVFVCLCMYGCLLELSAIWKPSFGYDTYVESNKSMVRWTQLYNMPTHFLVEKGPPSPLVIYLIL